MTDWLIDKSALWKLPRSPAYRTWLDRINRGQVRVSLPTSLEVAVSARSRHHWPTLRDELLGPLLDAAASPRSEQVAMQIMEALIMADLHRTVSLPDILIASIAVVERYTVLHDDRDFVRIAETYRHLSQERLQL